MTEENQEPTDQRRDSSVESTDLLVELVEALDHMKNMRSLEGRAAFYDRITPIYKRAKIHLEGVAAQSANSYF